MPELPEVEIIKRGLAQAMTGRVIRNVDVRRPDLRKPFPKNFAQALEGNKITSLERRGKYILALMQNKGARDKSAQGFALHLGMSGRIRITVPSEKFAPQKHDHLVLRLDGGAHIVFNDPRRFGMVFLIGANWNDEEPFSRMGPEPLDEAFTGQVLAAELEGRKSPVKTALLDQSIVAGVGNIYACEALYYAGVDPRRPAASLTKKECAALAAAIKKVLNMAIAKGGSTLRDYRQADGGLGYFQHHFAVYGREGKPPANLKTGTVKRIVQAGRSTFYCPEKQK